MDEKYANNEYLTILSNSCKLMKNKIISIVKWVNPKNTIRKMKKFLSQKVRDQVEEVAVDMANGMILIAMTLFRNAKIVIDRFHVRQLINTLIWVVKTRLRIKLSREENRKAKEAKKKGKVYKPKRYSNWETILEMITRCHYQIRKNKINWTRKEFIRWKIMSKLVCFKSLIAIYEVSTELYLIYEKRIWKIEWTKLMVEWIKKARRYKRIPELLHIADSIENKLDFITNYFISRHTNWYWEWLNSRIWKIIRDSKWFINNDYMIFRLTTAL